jgi:spore photoproduct lyase
MPSRSLPDLDLAAEPSTHRLSPGSKKALHKRYPGTDVEMDEAERPRGATGFNAIKYVRTPDVMKEMRAIVDGAIGKHLPAARSLYRT